MAYAHDACRPVPRATATADTAGTSQPLECNMREAWKFFRTAVLLVAIPTAANAYRVGPPDTFSDLLWRVSSNVSGLSGCTELQVDATGDLTNSSKLSIYGALNCPSQLSGSYGVVGGGYFAGDGSFNMTLIVGSNTVLDCIRLPSSLSGSCIYRDTLGNSLGTAFVTFR